jgi:hypothetical protein
MLPFFIIHKLGISLAAPALLGSVDKWHYLVYDRPIPLDYGHDVGKERIKLVVGMNEAHIFVFLMQRYELIWS